MKKLTLDTILCFIGAIFIISAVLLNYYHYLDVSGYRIVMGIGVVIELVSYLYAKKNGR